MTERILIYDRRGHALAEIDCHASRAWAINDKSKGKIIIGLNDPKHVEHVFRYGNLVVMKHATAGDWGGVIRAPIQWSAGDKELTLESAASLLEDRVAAHKVKFEGSGGAIFSSLIDLANEPEDTRLRVGSAEGTGRSLKEKVYDETLYDALVRLGERTGYEWQFAPVEDAFGQLTFEGRWAARLGVFTGFGLAEGEGGNIELPKRILVEQGRIANDVYAFGSSGAESERKRARAFDVDSIALYGLRQGIAKAGGDSDAKANVEVMAETELVNKKTLLRVFSPIALPVGDTFAMCRIGNILKLTLTRQGWRGSSPGTETYVRIRAREYDDLENKMALVVYEVS